MTTRYEIDVMTEPIDFEFQVYQPDNPNEGWTVNLPHQCGPWEIAGDELGGVPHAEAVALLEAFAAQATDALSALRERREVNRPWNT